MGRIKRPSPTKLIIGFIFKEEAIVNKSKVLLKKRFGKIDFESTSLPFCHTDYYKNEFGTSLKRKFISFEKLTLPEDLPRIKIATNKIEKRLSKLSKRPPSSRLRRASLRSFSEGGRLINIDPGYLDLAKLVLATTKDYKHRIYLNCGIYAEVTLFHEKGSFRPWEWTYPDYKTSDYIDIFNRIRQIYCRQLNTDLK